MARTEGSIYRNKQRPGYYVADLRVGHERTRRSARSEDDAKAMLRDLITEHYRGVSDGSDQTVGDLIDYWVATVSVDKERDTHINEKRMLDNIGPALRSAKLSDRALPVKVRKELERLGNRPYKPKKGKGGNEYPLAPRTLSRIRGLLVSIFKHGQNLRWLDWNPAELIKAPTVSQGRTRSRRALSAEQVDKLKAACVAADSTYGAAVYVQVTLGLRCGEILGLGWDRLDLDAGTAEITQALVRRDDPEGGNRRLKIERTKGHGASDRVWVLPPDVVAVLRRQQLRQQKAEIAAQVWEGTGMAFTNEIGGYVEAGNYYKGVVTLCEAAGVPRVSPTDLRRTFGTRMAAQHPLTVVADAMGHKDARMLIEVYRVKEDAPISILTSGTERAS